MQLKGSDTLKGTSTEKNLLKSFAGESQARMRYTYFASVAKKEDYEQISAIFTETADNEKERSGGTTRDKSDAERFRYFPISQSLYTLCAAFHFKI